jgi:hypothetical protein
VLIHPARRLDVGRRYQQVRSALAHRRLNRIHGHYSRLGVVLLWLLVMQHRYAWRDQEIVARDCAL